MVKRKKVKMDEEITEEVPVVEEEAEVEVNVFDETPSEEVPLEVVVDQVLRGEWGVGQDRRLRLSMAGHDPHAVQREIIRRANGR